jgi:CcmD family protein
MGSPIYLFSAFSLTWIIIFIYIFSMLRKQRTLEIRIEKLRATLESEGGTGG